MKWFGICLMILGVFFLILSLSMAENDDYDSRHSAEMLEKLTMPSIVVGGFLFIGGCICPPVIRKDEDDGVDDSYGEKDLDSNVRNCPGCGRVLEKNMKFCGYCGYTIDE